MKFILYRPGKNALGPFDNYTQAIGHMAVERLMGYSIIPMESPATKAQEVVVPERRARDEEILEINDYLNGMASQHDWTDVGLVRNVRYFVRRCVADNPKLTGFKIQLIKHMRYLARDNGYSLELKDAKDIVDDILGKNTGV